MESETLKGLYVYELKDLYSAERQLLKALRKIEKAADEKVVFEIEKYSAQTKEHLRRLETNLSSYHEDVEGPKDKGMKGIVAEAIKRIEDEADREIKAAQLIAAAQCVVHYKVAGYGTARAYAVLLSDEKGAKLLHATLEEEKQNLEKLSDLAAKSISLTSSQLPFEKKGSSGRMKG